jgi:predicted transcriptional regulator
MRFPLILTETRSTHIAVYKSKAAILRQIEAIDVENQEYTLYDSDAQVIDMQVQRLQIRKFGILRFTDENIHLSESHTFDPEKMKILISRYLAEESRIALKAHDHKALSLEALIDLLIKNAEIYD